MCIHATRTNNRTAIVEIEGIAFRVTTGIEGGVIVCTIERHDLNRVIENMSEGSVRPNSGKWSPMTAYQVATGCLDGITIEQASITELADAILYVVAGN